MLTKSSSVVMVDPGRPGVPGQPARDFVMFAPAPPKGYMYNTKGAPANIDMFVRGNWTMLVQAPAANTGPGADPFTYKNYVSVKDWNAYSMATFGRITIPAYDLGIWYVVSDPTTHETLGYQRYTPITSAGDSSGWYGPIANMEYITFPNVACDPNGHPQSGYSKADGYFYYGGQRYSGTYHNTSGAWYKVSGDPLPPGAAYRNGITACPAVAAVPPVPAVPPTYRVDLHLGWNTGANSVESHSGNLRTVFTPSLTSVEAVGFYAALTGFARDVVDYKTLDFAFLLYPSRYEIIERGVRVSTGGNSNASSKFAIQRIDGVVTYLVDGDVVYTSNRLSVGSLRVGAAIYAAPDGVF